MLEFFRAYQRIFFFIITVVVITSFVFFGTFSTFTGGEERPDKQVAQTIHGSAVMLSEVQKLSRFIATDREDVADLHGSPPNYCNDGVIRHDFLRPRLAELLVADARDHGSLAAQPGHAESQVGRAAAQVHRETAGVFQPRTELLGIEIDGQAAETGQIMSARSGEL